MWNRLVIGLAISCISATSEYMVSWAAAETATLTVWLMPLEAVPTDPSDLLGVAGETRGDGTQTYEVNIDKFNEITEGFGVTVINTTESPYRDQLLAPHPDGYVIQSLNLIAAQRKTLRAIGSFAKELDVKVKLLFVSWATAFDDLRTLQTNFSPDVALVGSTWVEYFASNEILEPPSPEILQVLTRNLGQEVKNDERVLSLKWRESKALEGGEASLKYLIDIRLIHYWKRRKSEDSPFQLKADSWKTISSSLQTYLSKMPKTVRYPMVFPIELDNDLLHNYLMLADPEHGHLVVGTKAVLTSDEALTIPRFLTQNADYIDRAGHQRRIFSFPMMKLEMAARHFMDQKYIAIIKPLGFLKQWHDHFREQRKGEDFWDYAAVTMPPVTFFGGCDLMILKGSKHTEKAFQLAVQMATDERNTKNLIMNGQFPAQQLNDVTDKKMIHRRLGPFLAQFPLNEEKYDYGELPAGLVEYVDAVRTAMIDIDRQREHTALPDFPMEVESREVLNAIQGIWCRIAEGNPDEVETAAEEAAKVINLRIHVPTILWEGLKPWIPYILVAIILAILLMEIGVWYVLRAEAGKILALRLYAAKMHTLGKTGQSLDRLVALPPNKIRPQLEKYSKHLATTFTKHVRVLVQNCTKEVIEQRHSGMDVETIVREAHKGAVDEYKVAYTLCAPTLNLHFAPKVKCWQVPRRPHLLVVVLQEWIFNCLKELDNSSTSSGLEVTVVDAGRRRTLELVSPKPIPHEYIKVLKDRPARFSWWWVMFWWCPFAWWYGRGSTLSGSSDSGHLGLSLIRDLLWFGFNTLASCKLLRDKRTQLTVPLRLTRRKTKDGRDCLDN